MAPRVITVTHYFALVFSSLFSLFAGGAVVHALLAPDLVRARARVLLLQRVPCTRCPLSPPSLSLSSPSVQQMLPAADEYDDKPEHKL